MSARRNLALLAATGGAAAAWELQRRADRRRIAADPAHSVLFAPLEGRPVQVTAPDGKAFAWSSTESLSDPK